MSNFSGRVFLDAYLHGHDPRTHHLCPAFHLDPSSR